MLKIILSKILIEYLNTLMDVCVKNNYRYSKAQVLGTPAMALN